MSSPDLKTGSAPALFRGARAFAQSLGVDVQAQADKLGIDLGSLSSQEEFDRLNRELIIESFAKFKGNLNQKEVELAEQAFAGLGRSPEGNAKAIATLEVMAERAAEKGRGALGVIGSETLGPQRTYLRSANTLGEDERRLINAEIEQRTEQIMQSRQSGAPAPQPQGGNVIDWNDF